MADHPTHQPWTDVETFLTATLVKPDTALLQAAASTVAAGMPPIEVAPNAGKLLMLLAQLSGARKALEIGTLAGFSAIWIARGLGDDGQLISCEYSPEHAAVAARNIEAAGVADRVDIRIGPALETLPGLRNEAPFDLVFIDADKANNVPYLDWAVKLSRPGTLIVLDNVIWDGTILDPPSDGDAGAIRASLEYLGAHPRLEATALQTVGAKGWDGFALARVLPEGARP